MHVAEKYIFYTLIHIQLLDKGHYNDRKVKCAQFLHDGSEVLMTERKTSHIGISLGESEDLLVFRLPVSKPDTLVPVAELFLENL